MKNEVDESVLQQFGHIERMKNSSIAKRIKKGKCIGSHPMDQLKKKRWITSVIDCLKKKGVVGKVSGLEMKDTD